MMTTAPKRPTIQDLYNTMLGDYQVRIGGIKVVLKKAVIKALSWAFGGCVNMLWRFLTWIYLQIFPQTCSKEQLIRWGECVGVDFKYAENAVLKVLAENVTASSILSGTVYKHLKSGNIYKSISTIVSTDNKCQLSLSAQKSGEAQNIEIGEVLEITNPLDGIPKTVTVLDIVTYGTEDEDLEKFRAKVLKRFRKKPQGGAFLDYVDWCLEVNGLSDALPYCLTEGTVTIFLVAEGSGKNRTPQGSLNPNPFPEWENGQMKSLNGSGLFLSVACSVNGTEEFLNTRRSVNAKVELKAPNYKSYNVAILGLKPNTADLINDIKSGIVSYLDAKRPNIQAIGYSEQMSMINSNQINAICQNIVNKINGSYTSFLLSNGNGEVVDTEYLGIGELAVLENLDINGITVEDL